MPFCNKSVFAPVKSFQFIECLTWPFVRPKNRVTLYHNDISLMLILCRLGLYLGHKSSLGIAMFRRRSEQLTPQQTIGLPVHNNDYQKIALSLSQANTRRHPTSAVRAVPLGSHGTNPETLLPIERADKS